ncbi:putative phage abortive infection protein [Elizabethkingia meningoseptica]|uniref:putative phage abortive infection protein n=1 Tax=Elizabethkingia TaxID=308865 RepID=UPI0016281E8A|nr:MULTISPECIES: putative phage abortive infection protein [Elizabethkingia]MCT4322584.1 putative phage abortive infection protein [Elizabethkingia anophelis]MDE5509946.1 putative phage abortive infection protein [Elizabethkingia meningoseptica]HAY3535185.1 hypothetical protein [Elizabethkingia anophelis]HAY3537599.1 hypothetical protein [Elizabethkingia anophelis]HAY3547301.1 hypothetical protein [Elizabethkingia anophelis]
MKTDKTITNILAILSACLLIFTCYFLFKYFNNTDCILNYSNYKISNKQILDANEFGDYFGGIMNPLIGITAAFITFLAFYIQYVANKQITNQFKIQQFESQFYEMLRLHKENVNEIQIDQIELISNRTASGIHSNWEKNLKNISGRDVFIYFSNELEIAYKTIFKIIKNEKESFDEAYKIFFNGLENTDKYYRQLLTVKKQHESEFIERTNKAKPIDKIDDIQVITKYELFEGHENKLGHYYRHLYHTVKFVANYDSKIVDYKNKRKYLQLLRAQLSNYEQLMLFYNWASGYGKEWELNKYFSDYRMIHNLYEKLFFDKDYFIKVRESIRESNPDYLTISDKKNDFLFEFDNKK